MILVDTPLWVDHLRSSDDRLLAALETGLVTTHPFVIGELACGNLRNRAAILGLLGALHHVPVATDTEALEFIEARSLMGRGVGYVDVHLLASAALAADTLVWTRDRRLAGVAAELELAFGQ